MRIVRSASGRWAGVAATAVFLTAAADARAEWRINPAISQTVELVTDQEREGQNNDAAYGSTTALSVAVTALNPRTSWRTNLGLTIAEFFGPGAESDFDRIDPSIATAVQHQMTDWSFGLNGTFDIQPTSVTQLEDSGLTDEEAQQISASISGSASYALDQRNSFTITPSYQIVRFSEDNANFTPFDRYGANLNWRRGVSSATALNFGVGLSQLHADDAEETVTTSANVTGGLSREVNSRLSYNFQVGPRATLTDQSNGGQDSFNVGATGSGGLTWLPSPSLSLGLSASQSLEPAADGDLENQVRLSFSLGATVNQKTSSALNLSYLRRSEDDAFLPLKAELEVLSASPTLSYALTSSTNASVGYSVTFSKDDGVDAISNRFFVTISKQF